MRLRTKVIALAIVTIFLVSVGAVGVASAQVAKTPEYDTTFLLMGYGQITQPGKPINVDGMLLSDPAGALSDAPVKVYAQRLGATSIFGKEIGSSSEPVLVATTNAYDFFASGVSVTLKQTGDYYVYAKFEGKTDAESSTYYRPSQTGMLSVKVTNTPKSLLMRNPTFTFARTSAYHQVAFVGDSIYVNGQLRSFTAPGFPHGKTLQVYCQYKRPDSDTWGAPVLVGKTAYNGGFYEFQYKPTQPGYYRFQTKFAGDPVWKWGGYDASASNYVDVLVIDQINT
jgi:hypothetical protein